MASGGRWASSRPIQTLLFVEKTVAAAIRAAASPQRRRQVAARTRLRYATAFAQQHPQRLAVEIDLASLDAAGGEKGVGQHLERDRPAGQGEGFGAQLLHEALGLVSGRRTLIDSFRMLAASSFDELARLDLFF